MQTKLFQAKNVPIETIKKLQEYKQRKQLTMAGVIIALAEKIED